MFVLTYGDALTALPYLHRRDLLRQPALHMCVGGALLTAPGIGVLAGAGNVVLASKVVRSLCHGIDAVARPHHRVDATPSESAVLEFLPATEGSFGLSDDERRPRHAFDASSNHQLCIAASDRPSRQTNCF